MHFLSTLSKIMHFYKFNNNFMSYIQFLIFKIIVLIIYKLTTTTRKYGLGDKFCFITRMYFCRHTTRREKIRFVTKIRIASSYKFLASGDKCQISRH